MARPIPNPSPARPERRYHVAVPDAQSERAHRVMLTMVAGIGPTRFRRLVEVCGDARTAWHASDLQLASAGLDRRAIESLKVLRPDVQPEAVLGRLDRLHVEVLTLEDEGYPELLRQIHDPPPVLFVRGSLPEAGTPCVAIVGTRRATPYGKAVAERFARDLAAAGVVIVSGLARGVDTVAHRAAVEVGGRTVAVLGNGLDQVYPAENTPLARRIVDGGQGAVISEFPPGMPPDAANFPRRNRIIAGLSSAILIVEAGHKSGALITSDFALEQGREVFAVPGSILSPGSAGANELIKQGASPATEPADLLPALGLDLASINGRLPAVQLALPASEAAVLEALGAEPRHVDELSRELPLQSSEILATLMMLELKGLARQVGAAAYVRA